MTSLPERSGEQKAVLPVISLPLRGGEQKVPESTNVPNALYYWNGYRIICMESAPATCDGIGYELFADVQRHRLQYCHADLSDEQILSLLANHTSWNPVFICTLSLVCQKTRAISDRHLWREFCRSRAPKMVADLLLGAKEGQVDGGWRALGKLFLYCTGCYKPISGANCAMQEVAGHSVSQTRFSCTSGRSFLMPRCRSDVLYVSDPCEHANNTEVDVGLFRGVFKSFDKSGTKKLLISKKVPIHDDEKCPFCKAGVWNMSQAGMIPKSASCRLAAYNDNVEYSVCLNGHVNGRCTLLHLSESDASDEEE